MTISYKLSSSDGQSITYKEYQEGSFNDALASPANITTGTTATAITNTTTSTGMQQGY